MRPSATSWRTSVSRFVSWSRKLEDEEEGRKLRGRSACDALATDRDPTIVAISVHIERQIRQSINRPNGQGDSTKVLEFPTAARASLRAQGFRTRLKSAG